MVENLSEKIDEFDMESALEYCGDDIELLTEMLGDYVDSKKDEILSQYYEAKDWKNYTIQVHSLKSTSRMVGFPVLGDTCEKLQNASESGDITTVDKLHPGMIETVKKYYELIRNELS